MVIPSRRAQDGETRSALRTTFLISFARGQLSDSANSCFDFGIVETWLDSCSPVPMVASCHIQNRLCGRFWDHLYTTI